jgi:hypothetical protein
VKKLGFAISNFFGEWSPQHGFKLKGKNFGFPPPHPFQTSSKGVHQNRIFTNSIVMVMNANHRTQIKYDPILHHL